ncbi:TIGR03013 family PEP-CTERM/XrtA system glycosyltransferase [Rhodanobacter denitrificans]|uniref:Sugar transferase, PEP-CTERM system associated/exopolysaccharide biosynthesis polyprenyl glycosylphosphotransferase n=1 Tax=Rhodanobacter denitrificans TaxID=666685 RepID=I4WQV4_9GAMM|nr:TIGR03013 family XrtA/PEP-CTERM system glycosyltransferase [Rhodanobacter denitrificans]AGG90159.1 sugar transferase, PEP-CTERM system associated/exopolysaccharide biosynthesis polyprenyl glycosylphosphotransferase [Rhodanobacter denitrificans]EIM01846.1 sugar transferase [Rhodanobacter denitrificans]UJM91424.1 TIGR03013 family PEP-CTERM/XrtA system glycosyltransferase [Rhodanobacter denitrificans]
MYGLFRFRALHWQLLLVSVEFVLLLASVYAAVVLRYLGDAGAQDAFRQALHWRGLLVAAMLIVSMTALGLYQIHLRAGWLGRLSRQGVAFLLGGIALTVVYYMAPPAYLGRGVLGITLVVGYVVVALWRAAFLEFVDADLFKRRVVMFGAGECAVEVSHKMRRRTDQRGFKVLGYVPVGTDPVSISAPLLLHPDGALYEWAARFGVDEIVVGPDDRRGTLPVDALLECKQRGVAVTELTEFFEREAGRIKMDLTNPSWLVFSDGFNSSPVRRTIKRAFDVVVAALVLLVAWPLMLLTALAIRLESGRGVPILYHQERVGENGELFSLIKFRSMCIDAERDGVARWASKNDGRVTRVGHFIRNARLDELPQLWNVLRGDMSIIGPRPERPQFVTDFNTRIRYYRLRHCVKPGLTGWAQLRYPYGSSLEDAEQKLNFDLFYVKNHNLVFDLAILVQTVEVVLFGRGAR